MKRALSIIAAIACLHPTSNLLAGDGRANDGYNVVWTSTSKDYNGSMPIGNGELTANVCGEPSGDIFGISRKATPGPAR
jgi:hypothetical protein